MLAIRVDLVSVGMARSVDGPAGRYVLGIAMVVAKE
jgi:hypothetical protein